VLTAANRQPNQSSSMAAKPLPTLSIERELHQKHGRQYIAGLDEAGRGALAGPVVAAAVILPLAVNDLAERLGQVNDSKLITAKRRDSLYELIIGEALAYGLGVVPAAQIDEIGILAANNQAMLTAVAQLEPQPDFLLVDGPLYLRGSLLPQKPVIRGDRLSLTIAAASILAKVHRDRLMLELDGQFPQYGFARHKGYATRAHQAAVAQHGPLAIHRHSFAPIRRRLIR
jgi:ribonuclease HII